MNLVLAVLLTACIMVALTAVLISRRQAEQTDINEQMQQDRKAELARLQNEQYYMKEQAMEACRNMLREAMKAQAEQDNRTA